LWQRGRLTNLNTIGTLGGGLGSAYNVNDSAHVVGVNYTADDSALHAVLWRDGTFTDLLTLSGYDCSEPFRINNRDQIVGYSFSCETGASSAFIWEDGEMVELNALIPADAGLQLEEANWINDDGVIAAQAVLTAGSSTGDSRAVLLIPAGECDPSDLSSAAVDTTVGAQSKPAILSARNGRMNPMWLRPVSSTQLRNTMQHPSN
jgi:probable HAF family extracellular repeat protein